MQWKKIKPNHSNALPRKLIFFDTETYQESLPDNPDRKRHLLRVGHAKCYSLRRDYIGEEKTLDFTIGGMFWNWVLKQSSSRETTWIIGHNIFFDLTISGFWSLFDCARVVLDLPRSKRRKDDDSHLIPHGQGFCCLEDPPTIIGVRDCYTDSRIVCIDSLNYFNCPLSELGDLHDLPKLQMPNGEEDTVVWRNYCQRDVEILRNSFCTLLSFVRGLDWGMFRYTIAQQSISAFRHRYMQHDIVTDNNDSVKQLSRCGYYGGRTEVFRRGEINEFVYQYDVRSLYPSIMKGNQFPCKLIKWQITKDWTQHRPDIDLKRSVARVRIESDSLPLPKRIGLRTLYATGNYETVLAGPELALAERQKCILSWQSWALFQTAELFTFFVDELWRIRQSLEADGNRPFANICKLLLNSLYGKFAQKGDRWENVPNLFPAAPWSKWIQYDLTTLETKHFRSVGYHVQQLVEGQELDCSFPAIAAFVTSYARLKMDKLREIAGCRNVYYQGVDALIVNATGKQRLEQAGLIGENELGKLRLEYQTNSCEIKAKNVYRLGEKIVVSGMNGKAKFLNDWQWKQEEFSGVKSIWHGEASQFVYSQPIVKSIVDWHSNGDYDCDNFLLPVVVNEDQA